ncbi:hypothetical protein PAMP_009644 [Pampus punctatissimus]
MRFKKHGMHVQEVHPVSRENIPIAIDLLTKDNIISWDEWVTRTISAPKKRRDGALEETEIKHTMLEKRHTSIKKLANLTQQHLDKFAIHVYNIQHQFDRLKSLRESLTEKDVVIHIDYSQNYSCKYGRKVKDTHFGGGNEQVTIHTGVKYLSDPWSLLPPCLHA